MIKVIKLEAKNFLSFGELSLDFRKHKLSCIIGKNEDSVGSSSNGAGKSSIIEAIYYGFFGKTIRQLLSDEIIRENSKGGCSTSIIFSSGEAKYYRVLRYRKHNKYKNNLYLLESNNLEELELLDSNNIESGKESIDRRGSDKSDTSKQIEKLIGMDAGLFRQIVLFGQGGVDRFSSLPDSDKKGVFEKILRLNLYEDAAKYCRSERGVHLEKSIRYKHTAEDLLRNIDLAKSRLEDLERKREHWLSRRRSRRTQLEKRIKQIENELSEYPDNSVILDDQKKALLEELSNLRQEKKDLIAKKKKAHSAYLEKKREIEETISECRSEYKYWTKEIDRIDRLFFDKICPECGQDTTRLDPKSLDEAKDQAFHFDAEVRSMKESLASLERAKEKFDSKMEDDYNSLSNQDRDTVLEIEKIKRESEKKKEIREKQNTLESIKQELEDLENETFDAEDVMRGINEERMELDERLGEVEYDMNYASVTANRYQSLIKIFSSIRTHLFSVATEQVNESLGIYSSLVSNGTLYTKLNAVSQNQKGSTVDRVSLSVHNQGGGQIYNACSSGEQKRMDLPLAFSIRNLALKNGIGMNILLLDEIFENIDEQGKQSMISLLRRISQEPGNECILFITHDQEISELFPEKIFVIKRDGESHLIEGSNNE